jgi:hypothetical protein
MKGFISQSFFGYFSFLLGAVMMVSPWYINSLDGTPFVNVGGAALFFPFMFGLHQLLMATFSVTKGFVRVFPIQMHCFLNTITGFILMCTPWMYGFHTRIWWPQLLFGALVFILGVYTKNSPLINQPHEMLPEAGITSTDAHEGRMMV